MNRTQAKHGINFATSRLATVTLTLLLSYLGGCQHSLTAIPLFNPEATLKNRIGSAYEVYGQVNGQIAEFVAKGWMTQDDVDKSWSPTLDKIRRGIDEADALRLLGKTVDANAKIDNVKALLQSLRDGLASLQRSKQ
jgi:hypothetical protein